MSELKIITNKRARDLIYWRDLTPAERLDFDYLKTEESQQEASFFRYRGGCYCLDGFMRIGEGAPAPMQAWEGYASDSYFSGVLLRLTRDGEGVIVGRYYS